MIYFTIKVILGLGCIEDGSTCRFSATFWDVHDYPKHKGGDGIPQHFHKYTCPACSAKFEI